MDESEKPDPQWVTDLHGALRRGDVATWRTRLEEAMAKAGDVGPIVHVEGDLEALAETWVQRTLSDDAHVEESGDEPTAWTPTRVYIGHVSDWNGSWFNSAHRQPPSERFTFEPIRIKHTIPIAEVRDFQPIDLAAMLRPPPCVEEGCEDPAFAHPRCYFHSALNGL